MEKQTPRTARFPDVINEVRGFSDPSALHQDYTGLELRGPEAVRVCVH